MNNEIQYLRWGLPGIIFISVVFVYWLLHSSFSIDIFIGENAIGVAVLAGIVGLSIPVGCLIYQIYFVFRWWIKNDVDLITQTLNGDNDFDQTQFDFYQTYKPSLFKSLQFITFKEHQIKWPTIESYWYLKITKKSEAMRLLDRYEHLLNTFHSLGAIITAIIIGNLFSTLLFFLLLLSQPTTEWWKGLVIALLWVIIIIFVYLNRVYVRYNLTVFHNYVLRGTKNDGCS